MPNNYVGQVEIGGRWLDIVESNDKEYVFHCLAYEAYTDKNKRIVQLITYVVI